jgi:hypothetical protein
MNTKLIVLNHAIKRHLVGNTCRPEYRLMKCWINEQRLTIYKSLIVLRRYHEHISGRYAIVCVGELKWVSDRRRARTRFISNASKLVATTRSMSTTKATLAEISSDEVSCYPDSCSVFLLLMLKRWTNHRTALGCHREFYRSLGALFHLWL